MGVSVGREYETMREGTSKTLERDENEIVESILGWNPGNMIGKGKDFKKRESTNVSIGNRSKSRTKFKQSFREGLIK